MLTKTIHSTEFARIRRVREFQNKSHGAQTNRRENPNEVRLFAHRHKNQKSVLLFMIDNAAREAHHLLDSWLSHAALDFPLPIPLDITPTRYNELVFDRLLCKQKAKVYPRAIIDMLIWLELRAAKRILLW
jgi:hypothetical protein